MTDPEVQREGPGHVGRGGRGPAGARRGLRPRAPARAHRRLAPPLVRPPRVRRRRRPMGRPGPAGAVVNAALLGEMRRIVGRDNAVDDPEVTAGYSVDWTGRWRGEHAARRAARSTRERWQRWCRGAPPTGVAVVPQGGNTGLVGGGGAARRRGGAVAAATRGHLRRRSATSASSPSGAGTTSPTCRRRPAEAGWAYGVDLAARDSATVGGTVATNAGGLRVLRHGDTRQQLLGIEAVLGDGSVVEHLGRAPQGQHRLPPALAAVRERGHPRRRDRGPAPAGAPPRAAGGRPGRGDVDGRSGGPRGARAPHGRRRRRHRVPHRRLPKARGRPPPARRPGQEPACTCSSSAPATTTPPGRWRRPSATCRPRWPARRSPERRAELWRLPGADHRGGQRSSAHP